ncbi:MAG: sigma-70 family RNA polymerase sigma factor [Verrucomicrobiales bacterium]|nr:sigma-70 family RNA polymerase sigma factor [Verrucomicrobiales bacterium]
MSEPDHSKPEAPPTRRSLIERLRDLGDDPSWREFFDMYWKLIYGAAIKAGLSDQEAEDVVQETVIGVARKMPEFRYEPTVCSFKGWLMHVTRRRIVDRYRRRRSQNIPLAIPTGDTTEDPVLDLPDPTANVLEGIWDEEWRKNLVDVALERVRRRASPKHYQIFHLHAIKGIGVLDVARLAGVSLANVYVTYHRVAKLVKEEVRRLERTSTHG